MTKENFLQVIVGLVLTALFVQIGMGYFAIIPAIIVAIAWAGIKQTSGKEYKNAKGDYAKPKFWKDFVPVVAGGIIMWLISIL